MPRRFEPTGKHPIVNADLYLETSLDGKYLCCLSERDVFIIRSYLWPYVEWNTRFGRPTALNTWEVASAEEFSQFLEYCHELDDKIVGGEFMTCLEDGLVDIAAAIRYAADRKCCPDTNVTVNGGVVDTWTDGDGVTHPIYGTKDPYVNDGVTPPPGFETYEEYLLNKCQVCNLVFDGWMASLNGLSILTIFNATALAGLIGLALASVIAMPPAAIPIMIGALIVLGVEVTVLHDMATYFTEHREEIICDLYNSDTVASMVSILSDAIDLALTALDIGGPIGDAAKLIAITLVNSDTLSQILSGIAGISYPDVDCSACVECGIEFDFVDNSDDLGFEVIDPTNGTITNPFGSPTDAYGIRINITPSPGSYEFSKDISDNPILITDTMALQAQATMSTGATYYVSIWLASDPGTLIAVGGSGSASGTFTSNDSLDTWVGEEIVKIGWYIARAATGDLDLEFNYIRVVCE